MPLFRDRITFVIIPVITTFNSHTVIMSYSLWSVHGEVNVLEKKLLPISLDQRSLIKFPTIKEDTNTHVHSKNHNFCWLRTQVI